MKTFHIKSFSNIEQYDSLNEAHSKSVEAHNRFLHELPFDISQDFGEIVSKFFYYENMLIMQFSNDRYLGITIEENRGLVLTRPNRNNTPRGQQEIFKLIFPDGDAEKFDPQSFFRKFEAKKFVNMYLSGNRIYLYFHDCNDLISISVLNIVEPPYNLLRICESD